MKKLQIIFLVVFFAIFAVSITSAQQTNKKSKTKTTQVKSKCDPSKMAECRKNGKDCKMDPSKCAHDPSKCKEGQSKCTDDQSKCCPEKK